jgi:DNA polymerase-3 subunit epsilon
MTGEIFLRLLPLLEAQGIATLGAARAAAEQSYLARLRY